MRDHNQRLWALGLRSPWVFRLGQVGLAGRPRPPSTWRSIWPVSSEARWGASSGRSWGWGSTFSRHYGRCSGSSCSETCCQRVEHRSCRTSSCRSRHRPPSSQDHQPERRSQTSASLYQPERRSQTSASLYHPFIRQHRLVLANRPGRSGNLRCRSQGSPKGSNGALKAKCRRTPLCDSEAAAFVPGNSAICHRIPFSCVLRPCPAVNQPGRWSIMLCSTALPGPKQKMKSCLPKN